MSKTRKSYKKLKQEALECLSNIKQWHDEVFSDCPGCVLCTVTLPKIKNAIRYYESELKRLKTRINIITKRIKKLETEE